MNSRKAPVSFNTNSYIINEQPRWLLSGELHYYKMTRGDWRQRLVQLKCAGFNTVSAYMPWNYHELTEGEWDFSGDRDVEHFLALAAEIGLYVIARPGPYICNEWHAGGLPAWLSCKPGIRLRTKDPLFLSYVDKWWDRIAPIIRKYELGQNGTVILAQVENEYGHYGEGQEPEYIYHLRDGLRERGVAVPIINCDSFIKFSRLKPKVYEEINLCCNFGGDGIRNLQQARALQPDAPLFVTEYWIAAFDWWGRNESAVNDDNKALNGALEIAAGGSSGLTAFVFSGGAHFGYWHGRSVCSDANFMTTLYGPGAPILDDGQFSGKYTLFKTRLSPLNTPALAKTGMPEITELEPGLIQATRKGPDGIFIFTVNRSEKQIRVADTEKNQACVDFAIPAGAVQWAVRDLKLSGEVTLNRTNLTVLATDPVLILYGEAGTEGWLELDGETLQVQVPREETPHLVSYQGLSILVINKESAGRCWPLTVPGTSGVVFGGPERVENVKVIENKLEVTVSSVSESPVWQFSNGKIYTESPPYEKTAPSQSIPLTDIHTSRALPESGPEFDDSSWFSAERPQVMAAFGHGHGWAWYRTRFEVSEEGPQTINFSGADDRAHVWVNGQYMGTRGWGSNHGWHLMPNVPVGSHTLAILVENLGMFNSGAEFDIPLGEPKGLYGPVWLNGEELKGWRMRAGLGPNEGIDTWKGMGDQIREDPDTKKIEGPVWISAQFTMPPEWNGSVRFNHEDHAHKGVCWLNGKNIGRYWDIGPQQSLWLPNSYLGRNNTLMLFEEGWISPSALEISLASFGPRAQMKIHPCNRQ
jgi:hypothetical protein